MEVTCYIVQLNVHPRAGALLDIGSAAQEQRLDIVPSDARLSRAVEDSRQGSAVLPSHAVIISYCDVMCPAIDDATPLKRIGQDFDQVAGTFAGALSDLLTA